MQINPTHASFGVIFDGRSIFEVPRYQRGYAWGDEALDDFLDDLSACYEIRNDGKEREHFFGGILSIRRQMQGVANESKFELVDGQQRVTTLTLLAAVLFENYQSIYSSSAVGGDDFRDRIDLRKSKLKNCFIEYSQEVNKEIKKVNVLTMSKNDEPFFRSMLSGGGAIPVRDSHEKLQRAYSKLKKYVSELVGLVSTPDAKLDSLERLQNVLLSDFSVLHMVVDNKSDAYRLFQVINDRGVSLTDGDLLRARVLEVLEGHEAQQSESEAIWDDILSDQPNVTLNYLHWVYESHAFVRAKSSSLADDFYSRFFPAVGYGEVNNEQANQCIEGMRLIRSDINLCRKLLAGEWPYEETRAVTPWDKSRLKALIVDLGHTLCVPLLIALAQHDSTVFRDAVLMLERSFFRFKVICSEHVTPLKRLYYEESQEIRLKGGQYSVSSLRDKLNQLLLDKSPVIAFNNGLKALKYQPRDGGNKPIKYLLSILESYSDWYANGAIGSPRCIEGNRVYDFNSTSIEHIYPRNASQIHKVADLEPLKNCLGNLTLLDNVPNTLSGNAPYEEKREMYARSSLFLNRKIAESECWSVVEIGAYEQFLIEMASVIFVA
ncbi:DUF262 domain-containing protein [Pseudomonas sp. NFACC13-1]|uniref:DUF262 domain-containing protein n=1 Tax=Pseudomonas sp. NFACC13-1 TaxID=1566245 RepID=UPI0008923A70|nr:DUF262 domain-containing protein [Pseudomonas sp. NFACC13-1]SDB35911.1 Protein of unknown function [Pseudomonas sp. NFACC13-1]